MGCFWRVYVCLVDEEEKERKSEIHIYIYRWKRGELGLDSELPPYLLWQDITITELILLNSI
jgi:hypothetical protein